ncbi:MAG: PKD domain-containing protein [Thermoplasmatota archaeon]
MALLPTGSCTGATETYELPAYNWQWNWVIAPHMAPLFTPTTTDPTVGVFQETQSTPNGRVLVVEWSHVQYCYATSGSGTSGTCSTSTGDLTFEAKIYESDNHIEFLYKNMSKGTPPAADVRADGTIFTDDSVGVPATWVGLSHEANWALGGTHGISYWFSCDNQGITPSSGSGSYYCQANSWSPGANTGNPFPGTSTPFNFYGFCYYAYYCSNFYEPSGLIISFYKDTVPAGANIPATTVNEGVPTLIQLQGSDPHGRPLFASIRPATQRFGPCTDVTTACSTPSGPVAPVNEAVDATCPAAIAGGACLPWADLMVTQPAHGKAVAVNPTGASDTWKQPTTCPALQNCNGFIQYTSDPDYNGPDSFTFQVSNGFEKDPTIYTATIQVRAINDPPHGFDDVIQAWDAGHPTYVAPANGPLANDYDPEIAQSEGQSGMCWIQTPPSQGICPPPLQQLRFNLPTVTRPGHADAAASSWVPAQNGSFAYLVDGNYACAKYPLEPSVNGQANCYDSFVYQPCDDNSVSTQEWTLPSPPTATPTAANNGQKDGCDGDPTNTGAPANVNSLTRAAYTRLSNVTLDIRHWNLRASPDGYEAIEDAQLIVATQDGVLGNDAGAPNATRMVVEDAPTHGAVSPSPDGSFTYTPYPNFCDTPGGVPDVFHYHLEDAYGARGNTVPVTVSVVCVDDPPIWHANQTMYKVPMNFGSLSDRFWATGTSTQTVEMLDPNWVSTCAWCGWAPGILWVQRADSFQPGPCTPAPPTGLVDECTTQKMQFVVQDDNPTIFKQGGQPTVQLYVNHEFQNRPFKDTQKPPRWVNTFTPSYGWLNFTIDKFSYGIANLNVCLKDDGIDLGTAAGPGSVDRACTKVTVWVPGPPMTSPDTYTAYSGHLLVENNMTGVLANDANSTGVYYLASLNAPDSHGVSHGTYMTATLFSAPSHAVNFQLNSDGSFQYLPEVGFQGTDVFRYIAMDKHYRSIVPEVVTITVSNSLPPGADFVWSPNQPVANQVVRFADRSGVDGSAIMSWAWDFGDGSTLGCMDQSCRDPVHVYPAQGLYAVRLTIVDSKGDIDQATKTVNVAAAGPSTDARFAAPNWAPPIAHAGHDFSVAEGAPVQLVGSGEPAGSIASYYWTQTGGPKVHLSNPSSASTGFTAPLTGTAASLPLTFQLVVSDGVSESPPSVIHVIVTTQNAPPVAHAGGPQDTASGMDVVLDGSSSQDPDGDALTYHWTQVEGPGVTLTDATQAVAHFTAPMTLSQTQMTFQLEVSDGHTVPNFDRMVVTVRPAATASGFSFAVGGLAEPGRVAFTGGLSAAKWDFGDGSTGQGIDPVHTYSRAGTYAVTMTVGDKSYEQTVTVSFHSVGAKAGQQAPGVGLIVLVAALALVVRLRRR